LALSNEDLDQMQDYLKRIFNRHSPALDSSSEITATMESIKISLMLENERRLRAEYNPRQTLQKD
jgi:hypothetical protein